MASQFETEVARLMMTFNTPGVAIEMWTRGKRQGAYLGRLSAGASLPVTKKTRFATVCLIKTLVSIDLLMMAEKGEIGLDDPIGKYLPELSDGPAAKGDYLKIRHLLSHTGGYRGHPLQHLLPLAQESWENCVKLLHDAPQLFEPGTVFDDDHLGHMVLGQMLQKVKAKPLLDIVRTDILTPLGITPGNRGKDVDQADIYAARHEWNRTEKKWDAAPDNYGAPNPSFGAFSDLSMTASDMLRLGEALLAETPGEAVISPWVKEQLFSQAVRIPREITPMRSTRWHPAAFGLGMATFRGGHQGCMTTGRGQNSCLVYDKEQQSILALAMNATNVLEREAMLNTLFAKIAGDKSITPEPQTIDMGFDEFIDPFTTRDIAGAYMGFTPEPVEIFASARSFTLHINKEERYRFEATPENRLVMHARMPMPVGLFQDPSSKRPCLTMGMHPFKKVA